MITVQQLIKELQQLDPDSIVLYAYDEYGRTGIHSFISDDESYVIINKDGTVLMNDNEIIEFEDDFKKEFEQEYIDLIDNSLSDGGTKVKSIKLFAQ